MSSDCSSIALCYYSRDTLCSLRSVGSLLVRPGGAPSPPCPGGSNEAERQRPHRKAHVWPAKKRKTRNATRLCGICLPLRGFVQRGSSLDRFVMGFMLAILTGVHMPDRCHDVLGDGGLDVGIRGNFGKGIMNQPENMEHRTSN